MCANRAMFVEGRQHPAMMMMMVCVHDFGKEVCLPLHVT